MSGRRGFVAAAAAICVLPAAAAIATPSKAADNDTELLAACRSFSRLYGEIQRIDADRDDTPESECNGIVDAWWNGLNAIIDMPARTPEGIQAKAGATRIALEYLATPMLDETVDVDGRGHERLAWSLVNDMLGEARS